MRWQASSYELWGEIFITAVTIVLKQYFPIFLKKRITFENVVWRNAARNCLGNKHRLVLLSNFKHKYVPLGSFFLYLSMMR